MTQAPRQRLRVTFAKGEPLRYLSHLDLHRTWERVFRRARLPLAYSQGFTPRPRFHLAAGLPVGVTGRAELLDTWLAESLAPPDVQARLTAAAPPGLEVVDVVEVDLHAPALQADMRAADYVAVVRTAESTASIQARVAALLAAPSLLRRRQHKGDWQTYDLRPLIQTITVAPSGEGEQRLAMRLQASSHGAGRPDEVLDALGLLILPHTAERTKLHLQFDK